MICSLHRFHEVNGQDALGEAVPAPVSSNNAASSSASAPARSSQPSTSTADFRVFNMNGEVEIRCDHRGYVFVHDRAAEIGKINKNNLAASK